jgi:FdhD protein
MDKVIGFASREGLLPLRRSILCVSGRLSFELVQKAAVAGCPIMVAVGAPSSLAVELGADRGVTLCGFVRDGRLNVYSEPWRIA